MSPPRDCVPLLEAHGLDDIADWASALPIRHGWKGRTCRDLWDAAPRGGWLLNYAQRAGADRRDLVRAAAACVRPALRFVGAGEDRPRRAIEAAERWADEPTETNRRAAAWAARDMSAGARWWAAEAAARAAAAAGWAASGEWAAGDAALAAESAERAAYAHGRAEGPESAAAARLACADAVRRLVPFLDLSAGGGR